MTTVRHVCTLENGDRSRNYPSRQHRVASGVPFINAGHLSAGRVSLTSMDYIPRDRFDMLTQGKTRDGDVLFCLRGSLGKTALVTNIGIGAIASSLVIVRPNRATLPKFVYHYLSSPAIEEQIRIFDNGTAQPNLSSKNLGQFQMLLPPLSEQGRIVAAIEEQFSRLDAGAAALQRAQQNLKRMRAAILHAAVFGHLTGEWGPAHPARLGDSDPNISESRCDDPGDTTHLPRLPHDWHWTNLGAVIAEGPQNGLYLHRSSYGRGKSILRINDFQPGWTRAKADLHLVAADSEAKELFALHPGDLVINRVNSMTHLGKCMVVKPDFDGVLFESNMMRIRLDQTLVPEYVEMYLRSVPGRSLLVKNAKWAVNQASINQKDVRATPLPLPPLGTQKRIVTIFNQTISTVSPVDAYIEASLQRSYSLRSAVLADAFSGTLVPQDPEDEPASILLERIAAERASSNGHKPTRIHTRRTRSHKVTG